MSGEPSLNVVLVAIDDDPNSLDLVASALEQDGLEILTATDPEQGWELVRHRHAQIVLLDLVMPGLSGMELLERIVEWDPATNVLLVTGHYSTESAVEAIQKGACDYLTKPVPLAQLRRRIDGLMGEARQRRLALQLEEQLLDAYRFEGMVGRSPQMLEVFARIRRVAPHFRTALMTGQTGTGKELAAQALHRLSPVSGQRFVVANCSAIVETLFESELFGHVKGSFTGATQDRVGLFEHANGGTVMLDEIGDMPLATQSKLLRVLQNHEVMRVGSSAVRSVDVRVVAATNRDLAALIAQKQFREDLYYRLSMVEIRLPSLTDRKEDLPLLQRHFIDKYATQYGKTIAGLSRRAQAVLSRHTWPGNVRELENVIGHGCMLAEREFIDVKDLPDYLRGQPAAAAPEQPELMTLAELERRHAHYVLDRVGGNKLQAASILGISRATLYRILRESDAAEEVAPVEQN